MKNSLLKHIATLGPIGYLPAPGTCATMATIPLVYVLQNMCGSGFVYGLITASIAGISFFIIRNTLLFLQLGDDPQQIVLDEVVGFLIVFIGIFSTPDTLLIGLLLFRFFDIFKPWPIDRIEHLPGVWGNMLDDVCAGMIANVLLRLFF